MSSEPVCAVASSDRLGEGPVWSATEERLYWFDIKGRRLSWLEPATGRHDRIELPMRASAAAVRSGGGLIMATEQGLAVFTPASASVELVRPMTFEPGFRTNDGKIDPAGNFWWSTMDDEGGRRPGGVYRTTPDLETTQVLSGIHIPNTIAFSADGQRLYLTDSRARRMWSYQTADLGQRSVYVDTNPDGPHPDGGCLDAEGYLWNAQWGGARVVRYDPEGRIDRIVGMPVSQPSSCAFGGRDLATLYVTSAWDDLDHPEPLAGDLFAFQPGVKGLALPPFAG